MTNGTSRREWMARGAAAVAGAGLGVVGTKLALRKEEARQGKSGLVASHAGSNTLQVICHGMMGIKLPKKGASPYNIELHVAKANGHVYKAGPRASAGNADQSDLKAGGEYLLNLPGYSVPNQYPADIRKTPNLFLSSANAKCACSLPEANNARYCRISLPMPSRYKGYVYGGVTSGFLFKASKETQYCMNPFQDASNPLLPPPLGGLTAIPLVHVFTYDNVGGATLAQQSAGVHWDAANDGYSLQIYAEPSAKMTATQAHFDYLNALFSANLTFTDLALLAVDNDAGDTEVGAEDLASLVAIKEGGNRGGNPADCISGFDVGN